MLVKPAEKKEKAQVISVLTRGGKSNGPCGPMGPSAQKDENCTMPR